MAVIHSKSAASSDAAVQSRFQETLDVIRNARAQRDEFYKTFERAEGDFQEFFRYGGFVDSSNGTFVLLQARFRQAVDALVVEHTQKGNILRSRHEIVFVSRQAYGEYILAENALSTRFEQERKEAVQRFDYRFGKLRETLRELPGVVGAAVRSKLIDEVQGRQIAKKLRKLNKTHFATTDATQAYQLHQDISALQDYQEIFEELEQALRNGSGWLEPTAHVRALGSIENDREREEERARSPLYTMIHDGLKAVPHYVGEKRSGIDAVDHAECIVRSYLVLLETGLGRYDDTIQSIENAAADAFVSTCMTEEIQAALASRQITASELAERVQIAYLDTRATNGVSSAVPVLASTERSLMRTIQNAAGVLVSINRTPNNSYEDTVLELAADFTTGSLTGEREQADQTREEQVLPAIERLDPRVVATAVKRFVASREVDFESLRFLLEELPLVKDAFRATGAAQRTTPGQTPSSRTEKPTPEDVARTLLRDSGLNAERIEEILDTVGASNIRKRMTVLRRALGGSRERDVLLRESTTLFVADDSQFTSYASQLKACRELLESQGFGFRSLFDRRVQYFATEEGVRRTIRALERREQYDAFAKQLSTAGYDGPVAMAILRYGLFYQQQYFTGRGTSGHRMGNEDSLVLTNLGRYLDAGEMKAIRQEFSNQFRKLKSDRALLTDAGLMLNLIRHEQNGGPESKVFDEIIRWLLQNPPYSNSDPRERIVRRPLE